LKSGRPRAIATDACHFNVEVTKTVAKSEERDEEKDGGGGKGWDLSFGAAVAEAACDKAHEEAQPANDDSNSEGTKGHLPGSKGEAADVWWLKLIVWTAGRFSTLALNEKSTRSAFSRVT
jgi:hypothetical protein